MESTRPIRALVRGLDALTVLNLRDGASVSEIAQEIRLPRTTVYRILETLCDGGFVVRGRSDARYHLTIQVRGLSDGFDDETWVTRIAKPLIHELCRDIVWPVSIATLSGTSMLVRESTDHSSPLAMQRHSAGVRVSLLASADGLAYLAHMTPGPREILLNSLAPAGRGEDRPVHAADLARRLGEIRREGHALAVRTQRLIEEVSLSVPVLRAERVLASLTVRFASSAVPQRSGVERFLSKLRQCAQKIGAAFPDSQPQGHEGAPMPAV